MKRIRIAGLLAGLFLVALPGVCQTAAEQMRKGIYTQETEGNLDGAVAIYRQIVNSGSSPRDVAAQAQYRLAQCLLQKGDLGNAAQEFDKLARSYADYSQLVSSLASQARAVVGGSGGRGGSGQPGSVDADRIREIQMKLELLQTQLVQAEAEGKENSTSVAALDDLRRRVSELSAMRTSAEQRLNTAKAQLAFVQDALKAADLKTPWRLLAGMPFDAASPITVTGQISDLTITLPSGYVKIKGNDGKSYTFLTAAPFETQKQGLTMAVVSSSEVTVTGILAKGGAKMPDGSAAASATTITLANGTKIFDRAAVAH